MRLELERTDRSIEAAGEPSLAEMTEKAIRILSRNTEGYFLVVEGKCCVLNLVTFVCLHLEK